MDDYKMIITRMLEKLKQENDWWKFSREVTSIKLLFPDKVSELRLDQGVWDGMSGQLDIERTSHEWQQFTRVAMALKLLFPTRISELKLDDSVWEGMKDKLDKYRFQTDFVSYLTHALRMTFLFPARKDEMGLGETVWNGAKRQLENNHRKGKWAIYAQHAVAMKALFPKKVIAELKIGKDEWDRMKEMLPMLWSDNDMGKFMAHAMHMKLLAAEEIKITDKGFEIIMPKDEPDFREEIPPMPVARKF